MSFTDFATGSSEKLKGSAANIKITAARASSVVEARILVKRCAEPCPAGESIKSALRRVSQRLQFSYTRTKALWYGEARRIDALEMDRLRHVANEVDLTRAISVLDMLISRIEISTSPEMTEVVASLSAALDAVKANSMIPIPTVGKLDRC